MGMPRPRRKRPGQQPYRCPGVAILALQVAEPVKRLGVGGIEFEHRPVPPRCASHIPRRRACAREGEEDVDPLS
jgi:hypothetical protein